MATPKGARYGIVFFMDDVRSNDFVAGKVVWPKYVAIILGLRASLRVVST